VRKLQLILASSSPRRKELLEAIGIEPLIIPSGFDERSINTEGVSPERLVRTFAVEKAKKVSREHRDSLVLGADTVVYLNGEILGKPRDRVEAARMLQKLSGRTHRVYTGVALYEPVTGDIISDVDCSYVTFKELDSDEINWYVETDEPIGKAGGYAIQGRATIFITRVIGDYTSVIGLPMPKFYEILKKIGIELRSLIS